MISMSIAEMSGMKSIVDMCGIYDLHQGTSVFRFFDLAMFYELDFCHCSSPLRSEDLLSEDLLSDRRIAKSLNRKTCLVL